MFRIIPPRVTYKYSIYDIYNISSPSAIDCASDKMINFIAETLQVELT